MLADDSGEEAKRKTEFSRIVMTRWLTGNEYYNLLSNVQMFRSRLDLPLQQDGSHPESIYFAPQNGQIYFILVDDVDKLGFPRLTNAAKKTFIWKRMNFLTVLPKQAPRVSYIVASGSDKDSGVHYRMHIVWDVEKSITIKGRLLVLCHVLEVPSAEQAAMDLSKIQPKKDKEVQAPDDVDDMELLAIGQKLLRVQSEANFKQVSHHQEHKPQKMPSVAPSIRAANIFKNISNLPLKQTSRQPKQTANILIKQTTPADPDLNTRETPPKKVSSPPEERSPDCELLDYRPTLSYPDIPMMQLSTIPRERFFDQASYEYWIKFEMLRRC